MASNTNNSSYWSRGYCTDSHTIKDNYKYEAKVFPVEDAAMLNRETFAQTQVLAHTGLDGEVSTQGDNAPQPFVTFWDNIKPGFRQRIYRDDIVSDGWVSKVNGLCPNMCGWAPTGTRREVTIDKSIQTVAIGQREEVCMSEFLGTWRHPELASGMMNHGDEIFVDEAIYFAFEKENRIGIDRHFWAGNYGSTDSKYMHVDGIIKIAVNCMNSKKDWVIDYDFTGLIAGMSIEGAIGGQLFSIPFNTSDTQTIDDLITEITNATKYFAVEDYSALITSATRVGTVLTVQTPANRPYPLQLLITDGSGICFDLDGGIIPEGTPVTAASISVTMTQEAFKGESPIGIVKESINQGNVLRKIEDLSSAIHGQKPDLLNPEFGLTLFVAPNVWQAIKYAKMKLNQHFTGATDLGLNSGVPEARDILGFNRIVKANYLPHHEMIAFRRQDVHVATDLFGDINDVQTGFDRKCDIAWFKNTFALGFQISDCNNVAGTFCGRPANEFTTPMDYSLC